jgi:hypothetical protein
MKTPRKTSTTRWPWERTGPAWKARLTHYENKPVYTEKYSFRIDEKFAVAYNNRADV